MTVVAQNFSHDTVSTSLMGSVDISAVPFGDGKEVTDALTNGAIQLGSLQEPPVFYIEQVLEYHPKKGYFVHWKDFSESERSWQHAPDMPPELKDEMKKARARYSARSTTEVVADVAQPPFYNELIAKRKARPGPSVADKPTDKEYVISNVLAYVPDKGYLVSWKGFDDKFNSWQLSADMPADLSEEMRKARDVHWTQQSLQPAQQQRTMSEKNKQRLKRTKLAKKTFVSSGSSIPVPSALSTSLDPVLPLNTLFLAAPPKSVVQTHVFAAPIASIAAYDPAHGFLVRYENKPDRFNAWLPEADIPAEFRFELNSVRDRYFVLPEEPPAKRVRQDEVQALVHSIVQYDHSRGYLVHYKGTHSSSDAWVGGIPDGFRFQALRARERWEDDQAVVSIITPEISPTAASSSVRRPVITKTTSRRRVSSSDTRKENKGEEVYEIEAVMSFHPTRGYLVKWVGYAQPTWQLAKDMPKTCREEMIKVAQ